MCVPSRINRDFCVEEILSLRILQLYRQHNHLTIGHQLLKFIVESFVDGNTVKPLLNETCTEKWKILQSRRSCVRSDQIHMNGKCVTRELRTVRVGCPLLFAYSFMYFYCKRERSPSYGIYFLYTFMLPVPVATRSRSAAARRLRSWVRIPPEAWMFVMCCQKSLRRADHSFRGSY
jgi:hypothetical protein